MTGAVGNQSAGSAQTLQALPLQDPMAVLTSIAEANVNGGSGGTSSENVLISPFGELIVALIQLQMQNTQYFKVSAAQASSRLQEEAEQQANEQSKQFLTNMANALQTASQTGELPELPHQPAPVIQAYTRSGLLVVSESNSVSPSDPSASSLSQVFTRLTNQVAAVTQSSSVPS
jgi:hypothetical protein